MKSGLASLCLYYVKQMAVLVLLVTEGKEFILFEHSAHGVFWDEPEVIKALKKYTR